MLSVYRLVRDSSMFMLILLTITSGIRQRTVASTNDALLTVDSARDEELKFFKERGLRFSRPGPGCSTCQVVLTQATRHRRRSSSDLRVPPKPKHRSGRMENYWGSRCVCARIIILSCSVVDLKIAKGQSDVCLSFSLK